jgi:crotonobetainyl-CoA:carnitine CoA-transferase CaiB-like acyl-CoA transferase
MQRLDLDEPVLRALNSGLIYVSISGVGEKVPSG